MSHNPKSVHDIDLAAHSLVIYDGECLVCDTFIEFIIEQDTNAHFKFTTLGSDIGLEILSNNTHISSQIDSIMLYDSEGLHIYSSAVLRIFKKCKSLYLLYLFGLIIPKFIKDSMYKIFAKNRYHLFGKKHTCMLPSQEVKNRIV